MERLKMSKRKEQGQSLVEFALTLPILLFVSFGVIDFGRALFTYAQASYAVREALRVGSITQSGTGSSWRDCATLAQTAKKVAFARQVTVKVQFMNDSETNLTTPSYIVCYNDSASPKVPGTWTPTGDQVNINQGDILQVISDVNIEVLTPLFPVQNFNFRLIGNRTVVTNITIGAATNDTDFDGLDDLAFECRHWVDTVGGTYPASCATTLAFNPYRALLEAAGHSGLDDPDGDGCTNGCEETAGGSPGTDPDDSDTDNDGLLDGEEVYVYGTSPRLEDTDGDGTPYSSDSAYTGGCTMNDYHEAKTLGTNALTAHSDGNATFPTGDNVNDWLEQCRYITDPKTIMVLTPPTLTMMAQGSGTDCDFLIPVSSRYVGLSWNNVGAESYEIWVNQGFTWDKVATFAYNVTSCTGSPASPTTNCFKDGGSVQMVAGPTDYYVMAKFGNVTPVESNHIDDFSCVYP